MFNRLLRGMWPAALLVMVPNLRANDLLDNAQIKLRAGYGGFGNLKDDLKAKRTIGVGFGSAVKMGGGKLTFDLNFDYFAGTNHDAMRRTGTFYYNPASPASTNLGTPVTLAILPRTEASPGTRIASGSTDNRRNQFQGYGLRAGYMQPFAEGWDWQAGLSLDYYTSKEEVSGTLYPIGDGGWNILNPASGTPVQPYYEGLAVVSTKSKFGLGFFAGVVHQVTKDVKVEANLRGVSYAKLTYQPFTYTGRPAAIEEQSRTGMVLEVAMGIRF